MGLLDTTSMLRFYVLLDALRELVNLTIDRVGFRHQRIALPMTDRSISTVGPQTGGRVVSQVTQPYGFY